MQTLSVALGRRGWSTGMGRLRKLRSRSLDMHSHLNSSIISKGGMEVTDPPPAKHNPRGLQVRNP